MKLYPYQQRALAFAKERRYSYLSLPCGAGKTLTALEATKKFKHVLIISPASICMVWKEEIRKWYGEAHKIQVFHSMKETLDTSAKWVILSYNKALNLKIYAQLIKWNYQGCIIDEAHHLKNPEAKRTEALIGYRSDKARLVTKKSVQRGILLSGTPMMQRPIELYAPLRGLRPDLLGKYHRYEHYGIRFCGGYKDGFKWVLTGTSNLKELATLGQDFLYRVSKEEVYQELPSLTQQVVRLDCARKLIEREKAYDFEAIKNSENTVAFEGLAELRHLLAIEKVPLIKEYVRELLNSGEKVIIFAWHRAVINSICELSVETLRIDGSVPATKRQKLVRDFNKGKYKLAVCQIKAANEGISFHTATHVVFAEISWNPADNEQAYKRVHRRGQKNPVFIHYLVANQSLDDRILGDVLTKEKIVNIFNNHSELNRDTRGVKNVN